MLGSSVFEQDHINIVVEVLFPLTRWFLPFQFAGNKSAGTFRASACLRKRRVPDDGVIFNTRKFMSRISSEIGTAGIHVSQMKFGAIINTSSGGCNSESETEMLDILKCAGVTNCK